VYVCKSILTPLPLGEEGVIRMHACMYVQKDVCADKYCMNGHNKV
jgi:hypothetical protein